MLERRLYLHLDWLLFGAIVCLVMIGVAMIFSTTGAWRLPTTQMYAIVIGSIAFVICLTVDYRALTDKSHFIYLSRHRVTPLRAALRHVGRRRPPLDFAGSLQPSAL